MSGEEPNRYEPPVNHEKPADDAARPPLHREYGLEDSGSEFEARPGPISRPHFPAEIEEKETPLDSAKDKPREGTYLLTIGRTGSGKTTFHWHLMRWLINGEEVATRVLSLDNNWDSSVLTNVWQELWQSGQFPDSTASFEPQEIVLDIAPVNKKLPQIRMGFFEVAGEDLAYLEPEPGRAPTIYRGLINFLKNDRIDFTIVFVADGEAPQRDDVLFSNVLNWLDSTFERSFNDAPIIMVVTKPEMALYRLQNEGHPTFKNATTLDTEQFVNEFLKGSSTIIKSRGCPFVMAKISVGSIEEDNNRRRYIKRPDLSDAEAIFKWIYWQATGRVFGETRVQRFWRYVKAVFS